jgi:D-sedoheptulose 7-phosphate isomerase
MKAIFSELAKSLKELESDTQLQLRIESAINVISNSLRDGLPVLVFGNGGSAMDALHISGELVGKFNKERKAQNVICLNANLAVLTAWSNDVNYESVFSRQLEAYSKPGGIAWGISTSGNSPSVVNALKVSKNLGMINITMTGKSGGECSNYSDILLNVPSDITPRIQELHLPIYHYICMEIEKTLT